MQYRDSIFGQLLKPISRRCFQNSVERHNGDAYDKSFSSFSHMVALIYAQLSGVRSLRALETGWNANSHHHYHLGTGTIARSTLADANRRRPVAIFAETFCDLSGLADRMLRREGAFMLRLIDATPIPLPEIVEWAQWNGRTRGLKLHMVYSPVQDRPVRIAITTATVNDVEFGRTVPIEAGAIYAFDKAYCDYRWWTEIHDNGAFFVTRAKTNARYKTVRKRPLKRKNGDGFTVLTDKEVVLKTQGRAKLPITLRHITVRRDDGGKLTIISNNLVRSAVKIAAIYKARWQIELLFRWIKQHLMIRNFLGRSENAIRLQIVAAMIAYLLLRIAARQSRLAMPALRFAELVANCLFVRKPVPHIDKPPQVNPSKPKPQLLPGQIEFRYA
jgi:putative transposase